MAVRFDRVALLCNVMATFIINLYSQLCYIDLNGLRLKSDGAGGNIVRDTALLSKHFIRWNLFEMGQGITRPAMHLEQTQHLTVEKT